MNRTIYWAPFLHFYQPPTQFHAVLKKICDESYRPLIRLFKEYPDARVTINICGGLTEMLRDHGAKDVLDGFRELARNGQLEFCDSSKYHAILPLLSEREISRQIELNHRTNRFFFGDVYTPKGFFSPEMCYSRKLNRPLSRAGYRWILLSGIACSRPWPLDRIYRMDNADLYVLFRDDILSNKISFKGIDSHGFLEHLKSLAGNSVDEGGNVYVITAMDGETFGHHIQSWEKLFLGEVYEEIESEEEKHRELTQRVDLAREHRFLYEAKSPQIKSVTVSQLIDIFPEGKNIRPRSSSWSTSAQDIECGNFYPLWNHPDNPIHALQWEHLEICQKLVKIAEKLAENNKDAKNHTYIARRLLDQAMHSCQFWWANRMGMWDVNMVNKGLLIQEEVILNAYKAIALACDDDKKKRDYYYQVAAARDLRAKIVDRLF